MRVIKILLIFFLFPVFGFSQIQGEDEVYLSGDRIEAKFNGGGIERFGEYIDREFDYSKVTKPGKLEATFTVDADGNVTKIKITQILDMESAAEFIRVLKNSPKWTPAQRGGKSISVEVKYPMVFKPKSRDIKTSTIHTKEKTEKPNNESVYYDTVSIEIKPDFPGGVAAFYNFIKTNYIVPLDEKFKGGKVIASFIIDTDGSVTDIKIIKDCGFKTGEEYKRVLSLSPKWIPGQQNGKNVRVLYTLPLTLSSN